jgi:hypothetical protein
MLTDLDELVSECADPRSRKYIREAVQCYKAGAYRASVVACWIALAFDLVDKIREVGASGDLGAQEAIARFDNARKNHDVREALAFEKDLLTLARDNFEFISQLEFLDLSRLADDRNRCAHPSQVSDNEVFEASPELSRLHIVNATRYVLSKPPAQGKAALERLLADLGSRFFPSKRADVRTFLEAGPLAKPRESLLRNYLSVLIKDLIKLPNVDFERRNRADNALWVLHEMHPALSNHLMPEILASIIRTLQEDSQLMKASGFIGRPGGAKLWTYMNAADRLRISTFVQNYPGDEISDLQWLLNDPDLPVRSAASDRIREATSDELLDAMWFEAPSCVIERLLRLYRYQSTFAEANNFAKRLRLILADSNEPEKHLPALLKAASLNNQVRDSKQYPALLREFAEKKQLSKAQIAQALEDAGLKDLDWQSIAWNRAGSRRRTNETFPPGLELRRQSLPTTHAFLKLRCCPTRRA